MIETNISSLFDQWEQKEKQRLIEQYKLARKKLYGKYMPIMFLIIIGILIGIGLMVGATIATIIKVHLLFGLGLFALSSLPLMFMNSKLRLVDRYIKKLRKEQNAVLLTEEDKQAFAQDMLENGNDNMYNFMYQNNMMRVLIGKRFILQKDVTYYVLIDMKKVEALSVESYSVNQCNYNYIVFHYPPSGKKSLFIDVDKKKMRFDGKGNRDDVFNTIHYAYNTPVIQG